MELAPLPPLPPSRATRPIWTREQTCTIIGSFSSPAPLLLSIYLVELINNNRVFSRVIKLHDPVNYLDLPLYIYIYIYTYYPPPTPTLIYYVQKQSYFIDTLEVLMDKEN